MIGRAAPNIISVELEAFIHAEDNLLTCAPYEIEDVIRSDTAQESSDESDSEDCPDLISWGKVAEAADTMKTFLIQHNATNGDAWEHKKTKTIQKQSMLEQ